MFCNSSRVGWQKAFGNPEAEKKLSEKKWKKKRNIFSGIPYNIASLKNPAEANYLVEILPH